MKLEKPDLLCKAVELISELVTEVRIKVGEYGMSIVAIDPANVAMVGFKLPKAVFSQFELGEAGEVLGVNLDDLKRILKRCGTGGSVILEAIFGIEGMGQLFYMSALSRDYPDIMGILMITAFLTLLGNMLADALLLKLNPYIKQK